MQKGINGGRKMGDIQALYELELDFESGVACVFWFGVFFLGSTLLGEGRLRLRLRLRCG